MHPIAAFLYYCFCGIFILFSDAQIERLQEKYDYHVQHTTALQRITPLIPRELRPQYVLRINEVEGDYVRIYSIIKAESGWNPRAVSQPNLDGTRDYGLGQLNGRYYARFARDYYTGAKPFDVMNPRHNLEVTVKHISSLYRAFGNWRLAVAAYNAGAGAVRARRIPASTIRYVKKACNIF